MKERYFWRILILSSVFAVSLGMSRSAFAYSISAVSKDFLKSVKVRSVSDEVCILFDKKVSCFNLTASPVQLVRQRQELQPIQDFSLNEDIFCILNQQSIDCSVGENELPQILAAEGVTFEKIVTHKNSYCWLFKVRDRYNIKCFDGESEAEWPWNVPLSEPEWLYFTSTGRLLVRDSALGIVEWTPSNPNSPPALYALPALVKTIGGPDSSGSTFFVIGEDRKIAWRSSGKLQNSFPDSAPVQGSHLSEKGFANNLGDYCSLSDSLTCYRGKLDDDPMEEFATWSSDSEEVIDGDWYQDRNIFLVLQAKEKSAEKKDPFIHVRLALWNPFVVGSVPRYLNDILEEVVSTVEFHTAEMPATLRRLSKFVTLSDDANLKQFYESLAGWLENHPTPLSFETVLLAIEPLVAEDTSLHFINDVIPYYYAEKQNKKIEDLPLDLEVFKTALCLLQASLVLEKPTLSRDDQRKTEGVISDLVFALSSGSIESYKSNIDRSPIAQSLFENIQKKSQIRGHASFVSNILRHLKRYD